MQQVPSDRVERGKGGVSAGDVVLAGILKEHMYSISHFWAFSSKNCNRQGNHAPGSGALSG
jgi:hypothetical protein